MPDRLTGTAMILPLLAGASGCALAMAQAAVAPATKANLRRCVTEFGAVGDGTTLNTAAIQKGIEALAADGGGTLVVPKGTFLSGAVFLKPGVHLHLEKDAVLKGSTSVLDYPLMNTRIEGHFEPWLPALVNANGTDGLRISGEGTLDGSGEPFWKEFRARYAADRKTKNLDVRRPRLMLIENSRDVRISGLRFKDSGFWNLHLYRCQDVVVDGLEIRAGKQSPSTDGIDVDSSQRVLIQNTYISNNDDCIALKGSKGPLALEDKDSPPVEDIRIVNCEFAAGHGVVTCGSEATIVRNIVVENCRVTGTASNVIRLKLRPDTPQQYTDIHFKDITLESTGGKIISIEPWTQYFDLQGHARPERTVRNITLKGIRGRYSSFGIIKPNEGDVVEGITLEEIDVTLTGGRPEPQISGVRNLVTRNVRLNGKVWEPATPTAAPAAR